VRKSLPRIFIAQCSLVQYHQKNSGWLRISPPSAVSQRTLWLLYLQYFCNFLDYVRLVAYTIKYLERYGIWSEYIKSDWTFRRYWGPHPYMQSYIPVFLNRRAAAWYRALVLSFLPSPLRYSSGWALASWIISLHFSLFFICSDDEASNGRMKKWEECGRKRSWPTYFRCFCIHFIHPRLVIWFLNNLVFTVWGC
jgi:hypothetical protein